MTGCGHFLGTLPCLNDQPHKGAGLGCTHESTSAGDDRHADGGHG